MNSRDFDILAPRLIINYENLFTTLLCLTIGLTSFTQSEDRLKDALEGKRVEVLIEMPATSAGINLELNKDRPLNFEEYSARIKEHGIALYPGELVMITKIAVKKKHIEFQLAGGGYGTFWDESSSVSSDYISKSSREQELERILADDDKELSNRKELQNELDDLRSERNRQQRVADRDANFESEMKKQRIEDKKLQSGSRFNIRLGRRVESSDITIEFLQEALMEYINFNPGAIGGGSNSSSTTLPSGGGEFIKGISLKDAVAIHGLPDDMSSSEECGLKITSCDFNLDNKIIKAKFVEEVLVSYTIQSK